MEVILDHSRAKFTVIPTDRIEPTTLDAVIEEFICREGTDYGHHLATLDEKKSNVYRQIKDGHAFIVFEISTQSTTIIAAEDLKAVSTL